MKQVGLVGFPVSHSLSPFMQKAAFNALNIEANYVLWETPQDQLTEKIASLRSSSVLGANVTIPYKETVLQLVDECEPFAARIGAINTIVNRDGHLCGYNTDAQGFITALHKFDAYPYECAGKKVVILGTGGAARAAAMGLLENEVREVVLLGRTESHLQNILSHLSTVSCEYYKTTHLKGALFGDSELTELLSNADLVINATPIGLKVNDPTIPIDVNILPVTTLVMDMIFNPPLTALLCSAKEHGCQIMNGLSMLLYQGALAFELWTGLPAPIDVMQKALGLAKEG
ncbi:MAG TPA: shikimate dehydrogenase [Ktedonobacteraceae bacterium]|nr:shikimate dehydrogenase [Ktedonobacteraceae bacterium]